MNTGDLYKLFRSEIRDEIEPFLFTQTEVLRYMDEAQLEFCKRGMGIADVRNTDVVDVPVVAGEEYADIHQAILTIRTAELLSSRMPLRIWNNLETLTSTVGYGSQSVPSTVYAHAPGPLHGMVIGEEENVVRWVNIPTANDTVRLSVYRLPIEPITGLVQDFEIRTEHHFTLLYWMKHLAFSKQDADTFDPKGAATAGDTFLARCEDARLAWERYKHKPRTIKYGGL